MVTCLDLVFDQVAKLREDIASPQTANPEEASACSFSLAPH